MLILSSLIRKYVPSYNKILFVILAEYHLWAREQYRLVTPQSLIHDPWWLCVL